MKEQSWSSATAFSADEINSVLLTIVVITAELQLEVIGSAFIIHCSGTNALCLTAAHNFERVKTLQNERRMGSHPSIPPDFSAKGTEYFSTDSCKAIYIERGNVYVCDVRDVNYIVDHDVAVFTANNNQPGAPSFSVRLGLDLSIPSVDDEVFLATHQLGLRTLEDRTGEVARETKLLKGTITQVDLTGRMLRHLQFSTTIPLKAGMSGSPFFKRLDGKLAACGVASFDLSSPDAFQSSEVAGDSTAAMIWPAMGLSIEGRENGDTDVVSRCFLADLAHRKVLDVLSENISVAAIESDGFIDISYSDTSRSPPFNGIVRVRQ